MRELQGWEGSYKVGKGATRLGREHGVELCGGAHVDAGWSILMAKRLPRLWPVEAEAVACQDWLWPVYIGRWLVGSSRTYEFGFTALLASLRSTSRLGGGPTCDV
eukprot:364906-Chlamydomonas_euryale.AAC.11